MSRATKLALIVVAVLLALGGAFLWALPEIVRRVALDQIPKRTGRAAAIEDVDLNLFTGHLAIKKFRLAERAGPEPFVEFERLDLRLSLPALVRSHVWLKEIALTAPSVRVVRVGPAEFNFSDLLAGSSASKPEPAPADGPSRWTLTLERLRVAQGRVRMHDRGVAPPAEWMVEDLVAEIDRVTTVPGAPPGRLAVRAKIDEARLDVGADPIRLDPVLGQVKVVLDGFEMRRLTPYVYVPLGTPYRLKGGRLALALTARVDSDTEGLTRATVAGTARVDGEALAAMGRDDPFLSVARVDVDVKEADLISRTLTVASVTLDTLDLKVHRAPTGVIDVVELFSQKGTPAAPTTRRAASGAAAPPVPGAAPRKRDLFPIVQGLARGFEEIRVERLILTPSSGTFFDESTRPPTTLALTDLKVRVDDLTWPPTGPATLALSTGMPGGGTLDVTGPVLVQPFDADLRIVVKDGSVEPYQGYIPVPAQLSGRFNGDSQNHIMVRDGMIRALSKGRSWARDVAVREPGAREPAIRVEYMDLVGIDFDWPKHARVARARFRKLRVNVEREADGAINLRRLFTPSPGSGHPKPVPPEKKGQEKTPSGPGVLDTMQLDFREIHLQDGFIRFLDRTTTPAFSQDLSRLDVKVSGFGNQRARRAKLALQSAVGGDAGLDIRGEIGAIGAPPFVDLVGELRSFKLPSVDPYAAANIGWVIKKGELQYKVRFLLDDRNLNASNEVVVGKLQVAPAKGGDEVKRRIGLPLGLIVALIKDQQGDIRANVPVEGTIDDPNFDLRETIWTAVKNVLVNIVTAPFKAVGRLFSGTETVEEPKVDPVTFAAGSSVLSPAMEEHLLRVADFLRGAPFVALALRPVSGDADVEALKGEAVTARLREFQKERGVSDADAALAAYYKERLPDVPMPATADARVALLREREAVPDTLVADLGRRRLEATRERLVSVEGIPAARLTEAGEDASAADSPGGEGRVEFALGAGEE
jgi:Domain of Unknown Function (DUF748)